MTRKEYAILKVQESLLWKEADKLNFRGKLSNFYREFSKMVKDKAYEVEDALNVAIHGYDSENSHYDIEDSLKQQFSEANMMLDSESGGFHIYIQDVILDEVSNFLKNEFKTLSFDVSYESRIFINWNDAKRYLAEQGITEVELPELTLSMRKEIATVEQLRAKVDKATTDLDEFLNGLEERKTSK